ncbi:MAG: hypothetical protein PHZ07_01165 [Patescibacteria group bacterium]|nr:hypothetical protein [Patescibacteria group bacterium]MDD4303953.1 hypothetical protein [Patescibacteria group bacterium]MDD4695058.1 hypothetical protein [Patescibacteria group bacterium]
MNKKLDEKIIKISKSIIIVFIIFFSITNIQNILATGTEPNDAILSGGEKLQQFAGEAGIKQYTDPVVVITSIIGFALGFLGLFFLILILVGGFQWMSSAGEDEKINKAKAIIKSATIGLFIVLTSWIIATTIFALINHGAGGPEAWWGFGWSFGS